MPGLTRCAIAVLLVLLAAVAWAADVVLSSELPLSAPAVAPAPYHQRLGGLASNGNGALAIWIDERQTTPGREYIRAGLYVSRFDAAGRTETPSGTRLRDLPAGFYARAAVVATTAGYIALWSETVDHVEWMRLGETGISETGPARLVDGWLHAAVSNGDTIFVVSQNTRDNSYTGSIVAKDGTLLSATPNLAGPVEPIVLSDSRYALLTAPRTTLTIIGSSGQATTTILRTNFNNASAAAASANGRILVAWFGDVSASTRAVNIRLFDLDGQPLTAEATLESGSFSAYAGRTYTPSVAWDGHEFLVAYPWPSGDSSTGEVHAVRVTYDFRVIDATPQVYWPRLAPAPLFASNGTSVFGAWESTFDDTADIAVRATGSFDTVSTAETNIVPETAIMQTAVRLASSGLTKLAVWREGETNGSIVASMGGKNPIVVSPTGALDQQAPSVGASGDMYLVAWREAGVDGRIRILAKRISTAGDVLDRDPIVLADADHRGDTIAGVNTISIASDGTDFLVVWLGPRISGARVSRDGIASAPKTLPLPYNGDFGTPSSPRLVWTSVGYLLAWSDDPSCHMCTSPVRSPWSNIAVARVSPEFDLLGSPRIVKRGYEPDFAPGVGLGQSPDNLMLAWAGSPSASPGAAQMDCVYAMPLANDGTPLNAAATTIHCGRSGDYPLFYTNMDVAWDRTAFVVAWTDDVTPRLSARALRISGNGAVLDGTPFDLADGASSFGPALAPSPNGVIVAYDRFANEAAYGGVARVFRRDLSRISISPRRRAVR